MKVKAITVYDAFEIHILIYACAYYRIVLQ